ncbi:unnamed protein product [Colias eurytheme]|nr:unnamed protein product [Colias eurytheme]
MEKTKSSVIGKWKINDTTFRFNKWFVKAGVAGPSNDHAAGSLARQCSELTFPPQRATAPVCDLALHSNPYCYLRHCKCASVCITLFERVANRAFSPYLCVRDLRVCSVVDGAYRSSTGEPGGPQPATYPIYNAFTMKYLAKHKLPASFNV